MDRKNNSSTAVAVPLVAGHTPGIWHVHKHDIGPYYADIWSELGVVDGLSHIQTIGLLLKYAPAEQQAANARLIASAPDLLAALKEALQWLETAVHPRTAQLEEAEDLARSAITAAEGGSHSPNSPAVLASKGA